MPIPSAAASGIKECPGAKPCGATAVVDHDAGDRARERGAGQQAESAGEQRDDQRLAGDQPAHLARRGAQRAQDGRLAPPLRDREAERAGHDEQRDQARDAAHRPEDGDQARAAGGVAVARVGLRGMAAVEHVDAGAQALAQPSPELLGRRPAVGDDADRVDAVRRAGQRLRGGRGEEQRGLAAIARSRRRRR